MEDHINFIITIAGSMILILIGVIGYLYKTNQSKFQDEEIEIKMLVKTLSETVLKLEKVMIEIKTNVKSQIDICSIRHDVMAKRISETEKGVKKNGIDIQQMGKEIERLKNKVS